MDRPDRQAFLLKIGNGADPQQYSTIAGLRITALSLSPEDAKVSGVGVFIGSAAEARTRQAATNGDVHDYELSFESGERMQGKFLVSRLDYAGDFNGERSHTLSLESSGPVVTL